MKIGTVHMIFKLVFSLVALNLFVWTWGDTTEIHLNETVSGQVNRLESDVYRLEIPVRNQTELPAIRIAAKSNATALTPMAVAIRQTKGVTSLELPSPHFGYLFQHTSVTLCPFLNAPPPGENVTVDITVSTSSKYNVSYSFIASEVVEFYLQMDKEVDLLVRPNEPTLHYFPFDDDLSQVLLTLNSESDKTICALLTLEAVKSNPCPISTRGGMLDFDGEYQTFLYKGAAVRQNTSGIGAFFVNIHVIPVPPNSSHSLCDNINSPDLLATFAALFNNHDDGSVVYSYNETFQQKNIKLKVREGLDTADYIKAICTVIGVLLGFYLVTLITIFRHPIVCCAALLKCQCCGNLVDKSDEASEGMDEKQTGSREVSPDEQSVNDGSIEVRGNGTSERVPLLDQRSGTETKTRHLQPKASLADILIGRYEQQQSDAGCWQPNQLNGRTHNANNYGSTGNANGIERKKSDGRLPTTSPIPSHSEEESEEEDQDGGLKVQLKLSEVPITDGEVEQKVSKRLPWGVLGICLFYLLPAYQLVIAYLKFLDISGNQDLCYYNQRCGWPAGILRSFNNIWSNIGYIALGFLGLIIVCRNKYMYMRWDERNGRERRRNRKGVPEYFGIYYALAFVIIAQGFTSAAYHVCPNQTNFQFDTAFMYITACLIIIRIFQSRHPDRKPSDSISIFFFGILVIVSVIEALYPSMYIYSIWFAVYISSTVFVAVQFYFRWKLISLCVSKLQEMYQSRPCTRFCNRTCVEICSWPRHVPKFIFGWCLVLVNVGFGVWGFFKYDDDFASLLLFVFLGDSALYTLYYILTKGFGSLCFHRKCKCFEKCSISVAIYSVISIVLWVPALYFFSVPNTDWTKSPAQSRGGNTECILMKFYDDHDLWHLLSAFALFFSLLVLMSIDKKQKYWKRDDLEVF